MSFERIEPGTQEWEAFYASHIHRYWFAIDVLRSRAPRRILDAACGVGYGSRALAVELGADVVAVDRDVRALAIAQAEFAAERVRFLQDDCHTLDAARAHASFDAVTSFETIEHLEYPERFLRAIGQCLTPDGVIIVSVPNGDVASGADWEFHRRDYDACQFEELFFAAGFHRLELFGQRLSSLGRLREQVRAEVNRIRSNPFVRLGTWVQTRIRRHPPPLVSLAEQVEDFEIVSATARDIRAQARKGPFVLVAVGSRFARP